MECVSHALYRLHRGNFLKKGHNFFFFFLQFCVFGLVAIFLLFFRFWKVRERRCACMQLLDFVCKLYALFMFQSNWMDDFVFLSLFFFFFFFVSTGSEQIAIAERQ
ncbi:hypothetical protein IscW_ISCW003283 [Ixodes scapularis]|uniref:Uncharacterized protein n=1 Tax=Ixodes scapularis TaxID=6945 RepID=B7PAL0_IXOSC|nr:hypothetical protein IscW_ISCW003283 [Ixodes scapularis]|eukprot:XP_002406975.1 hypothetical protein IscW_ISCW003283 [Ixodes scapularis]